MSVSESVVRKALAYNRAQGFSAEEIKRIQRTVGIVPDGIWGPDTVRALWRWQEANGIASDGRAWRDPRGNTWPAILNSSESSPDKRSPTTLQVGLWIDDPPRRVTTADYIDMLARLGVHTAAIMVTRQNGVATWNARQLAAAARMLQDRGIETVLTAWPTPDRGQIDTLCRTLGELAAVSQSGALEVDLEGNWMGNRRRGFASMQEAGRYLIERLRSLAEPLGARLELTSYPYHTEFSARAAVAPLVDAVVPQAYSVRRRGKEAIGWSDRFGPGRMQALALQRARAVNPNVICGLAAYAQQWPGHTGEEAMGLAWQAVAAAGCETVRYWSSKWVLGSQARANGYARRFLESQNRQ